MSFRILSHTADIGLSVTGRSLQELFRSAAAGFLSLTSDPFPPRRCANLTKHTSGAAKRLKVRLTAETSEDLFLKWLRELLYYVSAKRLLLSQIQFGELTSTRLEASVLAEAFDPGGRHRQKHEIKAVTYHGYEMKKTRAGWSARVFFDI